MALLTRSDPFSNLVSLRDAMNQLFEESFVAPFGRFTQASNIMPVDVYETDDHYVVKAFMPGITADELTINVEQQTVTIQGEPRTDSHEGMRPILQERPTGAFTRTFSLPMAINADKVQAELTNGVLSLVLPKSEAVKPRKIQVRSA